MEIAIVALLVSFVILLFMNVPIAIAIGLSTLITMLFTIDSMPAVTIISQRMAAGMNSFPLLAIPFFILSGILMGKGGIARRLIEFAMVIVGRLPGGLAFVNVISCALFGSISGSAVAATSAVGGFMVPAMSKEGYSKEFSTAVTVTASTTGMLIPPSNILIVYSLASGGVSIAALFVAGYVPGIMVALALMIACGIYAKKNGYPAGEKPTAKQAIEKTVGALPSLFLVFLIIGGITAGVVTPTEAGALAVVYAFVLSTFVYKEVPMSQIPEVLLGSVKTTAIVMLLIATSASMSWMLSYEAIPQLISEALITMSENPILILLIINIILLLVGTFMDMTPAVLIFTPIFLPVAQSMGISDLHFGIMMILNLSIGLCTPPVGSVLFVGCSIGKTTISDVIKPILPLYFAMFLCLLLIIYMPVFSEWLPKLFGLY